MNDPRFAKQITFLREIDKLKTIFRQTWLADVSRRENDAEHSWHLAMFVILLAEHATGNTDVLRTLKMVLIHDIVEIDAGDTFAYDEAGHEDKAQREQAAAERLFGLLPDDQGAELRALWDEFEARKTPEAAFAAAVDRLQPLLHNYLTEGKAWRAHGVRSAQVLARNRHVADGSPKLWQYVQWLVNESVAKGYLAE